MEFAKLPWPMIGALLAGAVLFITLWVNFVRPVLHRRMLKRPANAYFHIRAVQDGTPLGYVHQNDQAHDVKELVLPANADVEIEVAYVVTMPFSLNEWVFGIEGEPGIKPEIRQKLAPFVAKRVEDDEDPRRQDYWDRKGNYHSVPVRGGRSVGSCYTAAFLLRTNSGGVFKASLGFLTNEVDGTLDDLVIRVEDRPNDRMRCIVPAHRPCSLKAKSLGPS